jgi:hypothetical protein
VEEKVITEEGFPDIRVLAIISQPLSTISKNSVPGKAQLFNWRDGVARQDFD